LILQTASYSRKLNQINAQYITQKSLYLRNILLILSQKRIPLLPKSQKILSTLGEQIKLARLRRKFSAELVAERSGISRRTLTSLEQGKPGVSIGHLLSVLKALGLENDLLKLAQDDELGRKLQDIGIDIKKRAPKRR